MLNLTDVVLEKIKELGAEGAAKYFGKSPATIKAWQNNKRVPAEAAQKVMDDMPVLTGETQPTITIPEPMAKSSDPMERIAMIEERLARLEYKTESPSHTSVVPPQKQPNWTDPHHFNK